MRFSLTKYNLASGKRDFDAMFTGYSRNFAVETMVEPEVPYLSAVNSAQGRDILVSHPDNGAAISTKLTRLRAKGLTLTFTRETGRLSRASDKYQFPGAPQGVSGPPEAFGPKLREVEAVGKAPAPLLAAHFSGPALSPVSTRLLQAR
ncbi:hypothetical protein [Bradyrhizobium sp. WSM2793]|uniref:hypothetical protein n=1 Tax=Bradyrhizobium sp. WSM2793 TaxID=1038866 RepID=UPI0012FB8503|nr:hypothetical protein [Bradyrhizobium sp. WSM2793]